MNTQNIRYLVIVTIVLGLGMAFYALYREIECIKDTMKSIKKSNLEDLVDEEPVVVDTVEEPVEDTVEVTEEPVMDTVEEPCVVGEKRKYTKKQKNM